MAATSASQYFVRFLALLPLSEPVRRYRDNVPVKGTMDRLINASVKQVLAYLDPLLCYPSDWIVVAGDCSLTDRYPQDDFLCSHLPIPILAAVRWSAVTGSGDVPL